MTQLFSLRVHTTANFHEFDNIFSDAAHIASLCERLSHTLKAGESISVSGFARNWLTYDHGAVTAVREWSHFYEPSEEGSSVAVMLQNAPRKPGTAWRAVPLVDQAGPAPRRVDAFAAFCSS